MRASRLLSLLLVMICVTDHVSGKATEDDKSQTKVPVRLRPGDPLMIEVKAPASAAPDIDSKYTISREGSVKVALLDKPIQVAGLTHAEIAKTIEEAYSKEDVFHAAIISVKWPKLGLPLCEAHVSGEVERPRNFWFDPPQSPSLRDAIAAAGGFCEFADRHYVHLKHNGITTVVDPETSNPILRDRDHFVVLPDLVMENRFLKEFRFSPGAVFMLELVNAGGNLPGSSQALVIAADGSLKVPGLKEAIPAAGCSISDLQSRITAAWRTSVEAGGPKVSVRVLVKHRRIPFVTISGAVSVPTPVPWRDGMRVMEAIKFAGGFNSAANRAEVKLTRGAATESWNFSKEMFYEPSLRPGDQIFVSGK